MGNVFAGSEIIEMGIQIERNGRDFYKAFVKRAKNAQCRELFQYLADQEEEHIAVFQKLLSTVQTYQPPEAYPGDYFAYMRALAGDYVFTQKDKGAEIANRVKEESQATELAIGFEKDSILFYEGAKKVVPEQEHEVIDKLIGEEKKHLEQLLELRRNVFK